MKELLKQWMTASSPGRINIGTIQRMDKCHFYYDKNRYTIQGSDGG